MNEAKKRGIGLKIALTLVSILVIINLIANLYFNFKIVDLQNQLDSLTNDKNNLQSQVDSLTSEKIILQNQVTNLTSDQNAIQHQLNNLQSQVDSLTSDKNALQSQVDAIEDKIRPKEWNFVGEYTLTQSKQEETFHVPGEKWRFRWDFPFTFTGGSITLMENLRIYDEMDYLIGGFSLGDKTNEMGIHYVEQGDGDFTIKIFGVNDEFTFSFTVESYH